MSRSRSATSLYSLALCAVYFLPGMAGPKLMAFGISLAVVLPAVGTGLASSPVVSPKILSSVDSHAPFGSRAIQSPWSWLMVTVAWLAAAQALILSATALDSACGVLPRGIRTLAVTSSWPSFSRTRLGDRVSGPMKSCL